jgi:hypothetical protein
VELPLVELLSFAAGVSDLVFGAKRQDRYLLVPLEQAERLLDCAERLLRRGEVTSDP